ncbi:adenylate/guanylate cyclase domain-containing protein [Phenylobacterium sp.]|uniref:adenylate/guanylate cyclase domain-containing protein n=1 Tax=Phenylobacterium sp. TaxID=1871053 RepID=UPI0035B2FA23
MERRLTAIMIADVVGYSRLIEANEEATLARFAEHLHELVEPSIAAARGRIIKTAGDGLLAAFASVVDALNCAIEIQRGMVARNDGVAERDQIRFRVGLNAADVVIDGEDILGDGVNVAARLEGLAEPGGIWVSARVQEDAQGRVDVGFDDVGEQTLKNLARPVRVYRVLLDGGAVELGRRPALALPDKPSIVVLPFQSFGGEAEHDYFTDAITEDVVTALSRWRWFFVIDRNTSFTYKGRTVDARQVGRDLGVRYVLEGSVRRADERVRVNVRLIESASAQQIWADSLDRDIVDLFTLQDEVTEHVVAAIEPAMLDTEASRSVRKSLADLSALDCFQRGMWHFNRMSQDDYHQALELFRQAIARDPALALGYVGLARMLYGGAIYGWSREPMADLEDARTAALRAVALDPRDAYGYFAAAGAALYLGQHEEALEQAQRALALNPNFAFGHFRLGQVLIYSGRAAQAVEPIERSLRLSPYDPQIAPMLQLLALAHYQARNYAEAVRHAQSAVRLNDSRAAAILAAGLARLGRFDDARAAYPLEVRARARVQAPRLVTYANPEDERHLREGVRMAFLGEEP